MKNIKKNKNLNEILNTYSLDIKKLKGFLDDKKSNYFLIEGFNLIDEAKNSSMLEIIYTSDQEFFESYDGEAEIHFITYSSIKKLSKHISPQPIVGLCRFKDSQFVKKSKLVLLDNLQDPGNVGTIIRTTTALDYDGIILLGNCASILNTKVINASQGAIFSVPILHINSVEELKQMFANELISSVVNYSNSVSLDDFKTPKDFIIIFGNESTGVSKELLDASNHHIKIPIKHIDSINVSQAAAIILYNLVK